MEDHRHVHAPVGPPGHGHRARWRLPLALVITLLFVGVEAAAGILAHSLALLTDAAHNLTDVAALALSWYAMSLSGRPAHAGKTYGYHRVGILAALVNSTTLGCLAIGIGVEAWRRLGAPLAVDATLLMGVGGAALVVNLITAWLVSHGAEHDLNLRSAFLHLMGDVLSTVGAILAGVGIYYTGYDWLDPLVSVLIAGLILWNAWLIVRETVEILLESTPRDLDLSVMVRDLMQCEGVRGVHDLHVWSLSRGLRFLSAHILVDDMPLSVACRLRDRLAGLVEERYGIRHSTLQFETTACCPDALYCDIAGQHHVGQG